MGADTDSISSFIGMDTLEVLKICFKYVNSYRRSNMNTFFYEVVSIDGDYANLKRTDIESDDLKLVARALLPEDISEGSQLKYELMQYYLI